MRIVHVIDSMEVGGAETVVATLCRIQRSKGHEPRVLTLYSIGTIGQQLLTEGIPVHCLTGLNTWNALWRLYPWFRKARPDVVHCHNVFATVAAAGAARLFGSRVISTLHGLKEPPYTIRRDLKYSIVARFCDYIVAVCDAAAANMKRMPFADARLITRIYNGAVDRHGKLPRRAKPERFVVVTVGRLAPAKDYETLLRAVELVKAEVDHVELWLVGDGPLRAALTQIACDLEITNIVTFFGEQSDVTPFLSEASLFVMSSITEGLPMALLEAMSVGLPMVTTEVGGMGEVVQLCGAGYAVPPQSPRALADAIIRYVKSPNELSEDGEQARRCYLQYFTPDRMADGYRNLYEGSSPHKHFVTAANQ